MKRSRSGAAALAACIVLALSAASCASGGKVGKPGSLRALAAEKGITVGNCVKTEFLADKKYAKILAGEFSALTHENELKWYAVENPRGSFNFEETVVRFAEEAGMKIRGHALVWHSQLPGWVGNAGMDRESMLAIVREHCAKTVSHYKGRIHKWDVVNEVIEDDGSLRKTPFSARTGKEFISEAFKAAHEADPDALLYINDYGVEDICPKSDALYALCAELVAAGIPVNGVGFQAHWRLTSIPSMDSVKENVARFVKLGLKVDFTEFDVAIPGDPTPGQFEEQANVYADLVRVVMETEGTDTIIFWGLDDGHSWIQKYKGGWGSATMRNKDYSPKPAYEAVKATLKGN
jgi:endo-1,4-beta-xylanase